MTTREASLLQVEKKLLMLGFEINLLKFKLEEARPEVITEYYQEVKALRDRYRVVEHQIQELKEVDDDTWLDLYLSIDKGLRELANLFESIGSGVWMRLVN